MKNKLRTIVVGTRQSALAMAQTRQTVQQLEAICQSKGAVVRFEVRPIVTKGDRILHVALSKVGGKGLFVKEIEQALLEGEIDLAIHSMKDMPFALPDGLTIGAVPLREDPRDCLISASGSSLADLPAGATIGTSSLRRSCQLLSSRPDLKLAPLRGNIDSRLRKLEEGEMAAVVLAAAGLNRMGWAHRITEYLSVNNWLPAVGQGALCLECRLNDFELLQYLSWLNDNCSEQAVKAERVFLGQMDGSCQVPIGAYAQWMEQEGEPVLQLSGMVGTPDGCQLLVETHKGCDPVLLGQQVAQALLARGAKRILEDKQ